MAKVAKKTTRTRRRDRKNIELQIQLVMLYLGQVPAV